MGNCLARSENTVSEGGIVLNYAVVLSGGIGSRLKGIDLPKQYYRVCGRTVLSYCIETLEKSEDIDAYIIAAAKEWQESILMEIELLARQGLFLGSKFHGFAEPGENRQLSILNSLYALKNLAKGQDIILVQDAVRPLTSHSLIKRCIAAAKTAEGAMPVLKMTDTVYYSADGKKVDSLLERDKILAGQAPEAFVYGAYLLANERLAKEEMLCINGSTEPALKAGMQIALVEGEEGNFKITTARDLKRFEKMMEGL